MYEATRGVTAVAMADTRTMKVGTAAVWAGGPILAADTAVDFGPAFSLAHRDRRHLTTARDHRLILVHGPSSTPTTARALWSTASAHTSAVSSRVDANCAQRVVR